MFLINSCKDLIFRLKYIKKISIKEIKDKMELKLNQLYQEKSKNKNDKDNGDDED